MYGAIRGTTDVSMVAQLVDQWEAMNGASGTSSFEQRPTISTTEAGRMVASAMGTHAATGVSRRLKGGRHWGCRQTATPMPDCRRGGAT